MNIILILVMAVPISVMAGIYSRFYIGYAQKKEGLEVTVSWKWEALKGDSEWKKSCLLLLLLNAVTGCVVCYFMSQNAVVAQVRYLILLWLLSVIAYIDMRKKLIPNHILWMLLAARFLLFLPEWKAAGDYQTSLIMTSLIGAVLSGIIMVIVYAVSRGGLGFGDVKLFSLIGLYIGSSKMMEFMVYCFGGSALFGIALLVSKKAHMKDQVPLAPFAYLGAVLTCIFLNM